MCWPHWSRAALSTLSRIVGWQATKDAKAFLGTWGEQALALGWSNRDLFGLHTPPAEPHPTYNRLSRYDATGLIWLLQGRPVIALTETTAAIESPKTGSVTVYRKHNKPVMGRWAIAWMISHDPTAGFMWLAR